MTEPVEDREPGGSRAQSHPPSPPRSGTSVASPNREKIRALVRDVLSSDYLSRLQAASLLGLEGEEAAEELIQAAQKASDVSTFPVVTEVLESMGRAARRPALKAIRAAELKRPRDVYLVECLLDVLPEGRDAEAAEAIASVLDKCLAAIERNGNSVLVSLCQHARLKVHSVLGEMGERRCLDDLIRLVSETGPHLRPETIEALHEIGDRRAISPLLRSFEAQESGALREDIRDALLQVLKREGLTPDSDYVQQLPAAEKATLARLLPRARNGHSNGNGHSNSNGNGYHKV